MPDRGQRIRHATSSLAVIAATTILGCGSTSEGSPSSTATRDSAESRQLAPGGKHISRADCLSLRDYLSHSLHRPVQAEPRPVPVRFSQCGLRSDLGLVVVYLDATVPIRKRYLSRIDGIKAGPNRGADRLQPIAGLGESRDGEPGAYWLPGISSLYAYREDGWMTLLYTLEGESSSQQRAGATALGTRALALTES